MERYQRQIIMPEIGQAGQQKLSHGRVLCIGAGGLGCPALLYLTAAGVGHIGIVDFDKVELSNLQRQVLFSEQDIHENKAVAAKKHLAKLNSAITITAYPEELSPQNAEALFNAYDVIIDATDNFNTKFFINDMATKLQKSWVYGAIESFSGQLATFSPHTCCYRCLYPKPPQTVIKNCAELGVIGAIAGTIGSLQAMEAIKILLQHKDLPPLQNKLVITDVAHMTTRKLSLHKQAGCVCHSPQNITPTWQPQTVCAPSNTIAASDIANHKDALFIDLRTASERASGYIANDKHHPLDQLVANLDCLQPYQDTPIIFYCQTGVRSAQAVALCQQKGWRDVRHIAGGYKAVVANCSANNLKAT